MPSFAPDEQMSEDPCPRCENPLWVSGVTTKPLYDRHGEYYLGHECPHCGHIIDRLVPDGCTLAASLRQRAEPEPEQWTVKDGYEATLQTPDTG